MPCPDCADLLSALEKLFTTCEAPTCAMNKAAMALQKAHGLESRTIFVTGPVPEEPKQGV
jgi:hypothetical protein